MPSHCLPRRHTQRRHRRQPDRRHAGQLAAEAVGRTLATRRLELTDDPGMKDMLNFLIARDTMHQQQWLAVLEELGPAAMRQGPAGTASLRAGLGAGPPAALTAPVA